MITLHALPSGNCQRVSIMLEELALPYQVTMLDFTAGDLASPAFLAINPIGQVPAISVEGGADDGLALAESAAILQWLARREGRFLPTDAERIEADRWLAIVSGGLQSALTTIFFARMLDAEAHTRIIEKLVADARRYLRAMDARLAAVPYLAGDSYTYVDMIAFTIANRTLEVVGIVVADYPAIDRWRAGLAGRPAIQRGIEALAPRS